MTWNIIALHHSKKAFHVVKALLTLMPLFQPLLKQTKLQIYS